jgi:hypothetical protein
MGKRRSGSERRRRIDLDASSTEEVLRIYERVIGPLAPQSKRRMVKEARLRGWDRSWSDVELAGV